jgi:hypothetical protein
LPLDDALQLTGAALQGRLPVPHPAMQRVRLNRALQRRHEVISIERLLDVVAEFEARLPVGKFEVRGLRFEVRGCNNSVNLSS